MSNLISSGLSKRIDSNDVDESKVYIPTQSTTDVTEGRLLKVGDTGKQLTIIERNETLAGITPPTLNLDMANSEYSVIGTDGDMTEAPFEDIMTVTRSTTATRVDHRGMIVPVAINEKRMNFDPVTGERSLLVEEARTNLLLNSNIAPPNTFQNCTHTVVTGVSPVAGVTQIREVTITGSVTSTSYHLRYGASSGGSIGTIYSGSVYVRSDSPVSLTIDTNDGMRASHTTTHEWVRIDSVSGNSTELRFFDIRFDDGQVGAVVQLAGSQLEVGSTPSSYIPTEASAVTRAADNVSRTFAAGEFNSSEGTLLVELCGEISPSSATDFGIIYTLDDGTSANKIYAIRRLTGKYSFYVFANSVQQDSFAHLSLGQISKIAISYSKSNNTCATYVDGVLRNSGTFSGFSSNLTGMGLSSPGPNVGGVSVGKADFQNVKIYPRALTESECIALTTL